RAHRRLDLRQPGDHDHLDLGMRFLDPLQDVHAVQARHHDVQDEHLEAAFLDLAQPLAPVGRAVDFEVTCQYPSAAVHDEILVVDDQDAVAHACTRSCSFVRSLACGSRGRKTRNTDPAPTVLCTSIAPPCARTMPWLTDSPSPVPLPTSLV